MYLPDVELHNAATLEEAGVALAQHAPDVRLLAGGTDLLVDLKTGRINCNHLVSIKSVAELHGLSETDKGLSIGALTTISQVNRDAAVRARFAPLLDATGKMAAQQIRNVATVGGNIASAVPCADMPPILISMNASIVLWSPKGRREMPLHEFFTGPRQTVRRDDEVLTTIMVPKPPPGFGAAYVRFQLRDGNAVSVAAVAASLLLDADNVVRDARIVLGAVAPVPKLVEQTGAALIGETPSDEVFARAAKVAMQAAEPIADLRGSARFRRELTEVLTRRALIAACQRAKETR